MIKMSVVGADGLVRNFKKLDKEIKDKIQLELNAWADDTAQMAKQLVASNSSDEGNLLRSIKPVYAKLSGGKGNAAVVAQASYAAYIEFGTRKFAAAYVASLPQTWQEIASKSKGSAGGGDFYDLLLAIAMWIRRKGLFARYSVKTRKRLKTTKKEADLELQAAWPIAWKIVKEGIRPRPFLYPSVNKTYPELIERLQKILK